MAEDELKKANELKIDIEKKKSWLQKLKKFRESDRDIREINIFKDPTAGNESKMSIIKGDVNLHQVFDKIILVVSVELEALEKAFAALPGTAL